MIDTWVTGRLFKHKVLLKAGKRKIKKFSTMKFQYFSTTNGALLTRSSASPNSLPFWLMLPYRE